ncbi:MAG: aminotransferase class V-fold PLP-dependent enzyme [Actinomycetota bacterium]|nr:aminotransferase class V-fold PLP-dependent enzyme [Actinomycetota bacterium]
MGGGDDLAALTRAEAEALDAADPLAGFRERFVDEAPDRIYLDGNSLGRLPVATRDRLTALVAEWGERLVSAWPDWIDAPSRVGDLLAGGVLGAGPGEVVVSDSTTVNLYKLAGALIAGRPGALVTDTGNFPTDRYVLEGLGRELRQFESDPLHGPQPEDVARACTTGDVALVSLSHVAYRSGALADVEAIEAAAGGVPVLWDLSHSAGAVPVGLRARGAAYAVGCTYKYLNAGPGAPAFLYVREDRQAGLRSPIQGWFGQRDQFAMERPYDPEPGIRRFLAGTPPILDLAAVEEGVRLVAEAGIAAIRAKSIALTELIVAYADEHLAPLGFSLGSPRDPAARGSHVSLRHPQAWPVCRAMIDRAGVVPDFRGPDSIRLGVAPLYTSHAGVLEALDRVRGLVERGEHEGVDATPSRVT